MNDVDIIVFEQCCLFSTMSLFFGGGGWGIRILFERIRNSVIFKLACNFLEISVPSYQGFGGKKTKFLKNFSTKNEIINIMDKIIQYESMNQKT